MASIYKRGDVFWVKWKDPVSRKICRETTNIKTTSTQSMREVNRIKTTKSLIELSGPKLTKTTTWESWIPSFIDYRYPSDSYRKRSVICIWTTLSTYFSEKGIEDIHQLTRQHCTEYITWRKAAGGFRGKRSHKHPINLNTIAVELSILKLICKEAIARKYIIFSPMDGVIRPKQQPKVKPQLTTIQIRAIRHRINHLKQTANSEKEIELATMFHRSFEVSLATGCRLSETRLTSNQICLETMTIHFKIKGGDTHSVSIPPHLLPMFQEMAKNKEPHTYPVIPAIGSYWHRFFAQMSRVDHSFKGVSFHCLRVTFISYLEQSGVAESVVRNLVRHCGTIVHRVYRRISDSERQTAWEHLRNLCEDKPLSSENPYAAQPTPAPAQSK